MILDPMQNNMLGYQGFIFITTLLAAGFMQGMYVAKITAIVSDNVKYSFCWMAQIQAMHDV